MIDFLIATANDDGDDDDENNTFLPFNRATIIQNEYQHQHQHAVIVDITKNGKIRVVLFEQQQTSHYPCIYACTGRFDVRLLYRILLAFSLFSARHEF